MKKFFSFMLISAILLQPALIFAEEEKMPSIPAAASEKADDLALDAGQASDDLDLGDDLNAGDEDEGMKADMPDAKQAAADTADDMKN